MRTVYLGVLVLGLALAGFAVYMAQNYIGRTQAQLESERALRAKVGRLVEVYAVTKSVNYGDELTPEDVQLVYLQESALPEGVFTPETPLFAEGEKEPRYVLRQMDKFEPVLAGKVTAPGETAGLTNMLKPGQRAFTIQFKDAAGANKTLQPTNHVDIYLTHPSPSAIDGGLETIRLEEAIEVIAVDRPAPAKGAAEGEVAPPRSMTVAVTPQQVARLTQAQASGDLTVSLVAKADEQMTDGGAVSTVDDPVLGAKMAAEPAPVEAQRCYRKIRKGTEVLSEEIACTN
ncbi:Flp pilus assembly protein CpaB [Gemmobacter lanyuensis]|uniref:Flp pilus assembly protein CpaB n=1 Tax=Gemmobacter lanyuensis TaxID=1054497 RepID=A0A918INX8_9RHOB|nr:Flp pilus assembly protein CpaB [Gemmobacter lanyuensis]GGW24217.1 Flp pilus assembly protein CpaB [Gemmobacter lanyuensis]